MQYCSERDTVQLSVRELCAEAKRPQHLDLRVGGRHPSADRAAEGLEAHRRLRETAEEGSAFEVALSNVTEAGGIRFEVHGRADVVCLGEIAVVEEIKTVAGKALDREPDAIHEAQAMCYAYFLCKEHALREIEVRLTLYRTEDSRRRCFRRRCTADETEDYYRELLSAVLLKAGGLREKHLQRLPSVKQTGRFPYSSVREGQDAMIRACYRAISRGKRLFVQAPTGTGKTVSALYPSVRAMGDGKCDRIFYLTAKASTRREAFRACSKLFEAGSRLRTVVLSAREQMCFNQAALEDPAGITPHCNPEDCRGACNFRGKSEAAILRLLSEQSGFTSASVAKVAAEFGVCPYELQLELSELCDILICDYNYAFDPLVYLRRYFEPDAVAEGRNVFLVDEAHNLGDRTCAMYSAELRLSEAEQAARAAMELVPELAESGQPLEEWVASLRKMGELCRDELQCDEDGTPHGFYLNREPSESFHEDARRCLASLEKWLFGKRRHPFEVEAIRLRGLLRRYLRIAEEYDSHFLTLVSVEGAEITVRLICRDPSELLNRLMKRARSSILFSATLTPIDYFSNVLGGGRGAELLSLPSPYDPARVRIVAATGVNTRYGDRDGSYKRVAAHIAATVSPKAGNYIFYFPSYDYLERVYRIFTERNPRVETVKQERGMTAEQRERFIEAFTEEKKLRVGFCVMGGAFSEGVDLPGRRLIGVGIVGVGLPGLSNERNLLREYYDLNGEAGYDYAYTFPGMNRVLQAAGRLIRREDDCGVIVLMDDRYAEERYKGLFPLHWNQVYYAGKATELANIIADFWKNFSDDGKK